MDDGCHVDTDMSHAKDLFKREDLLVLQFSFVGSAGVGPVMHVPHGAVVSPPNLDKSSTRRFQSWYLCSSRSA